MEKGFVRSLVRSDSPRPLSRELSIPSGITRTPWTNESYALVNGQTTGRRRIEGETGSSRRLGFWWTEWNGEAVGWIVSRRLEVSHRWLLTRGSNEQDIGGRRHARRQDLVNRGNKAARRDKKWRCSKKVARRGEFGKGMTRIRDASVCVSVGTLNRLLMYVIIVI